MNNMNLLSKFKDKVGIHTGAGFRDNEFKRKEWLDEYWTDLITMIIKRRWLPVIFGGEKEEKRVIEILKGINDLTYYDYVGWLSIDKTMEEISKCDCFVSIDSGLMHIASALKVPTIGLFGATNPVKNPPWKGKVLSVKSCSNQPCYDGNWNGYCDSNKCMSLITPAIVMREVENVLGK